MAGLNRAKRTPVRIRALWLQAEGQRAQDVLLGVVSQQVVVRSDDIVSTF
jgi:hypothetical protein